MKSLKKLVFLVISAFLLNSCYQTKKEYIVKIKVQKLKKNEIYFAEKVSDVIFDSEEQNIDSLKNKSRALFLKGIDAYKNKNNPSKGIELFISSILVFPDAKTYYELGNALLENNKEGEAIDAYEVAERLNFQPISTIYYKIASCYYTMYKNTNESEDEEGTKEIFLHRSLYNLSRAFNNGFSDTLRLLKDPNINQISSVPEFKLMYMEARIKRANSNVNYLFNLYRNAFIDTQGKFTITASQVDMKDYKNSINYDFAKFIPEMENTEFGRSVSNDYFYIAKLEQNETFTAVIYSSVSFYGEGMQPVYTSLATYDNNGDIISKKVISCQCSATKIKQVKIEDRQVMVEEFKREWQKPIDQVPFEENSVKSMDFVAKATYKIDDSGKIIPLEVPENFNDSTTVARQ